jgi:ABC-type nitrate/sulfonate/bicarbonate transport system permease component
MHKRIHSYLSFRGVVVTLIFFLIPFIFLLLFSKMAKLETKDLFFDVSISISRMFIAYVLAAFLGWFFAVSFYSGKKASIILPIFEVLQSFPTFAALPLAVIYWGNKDSIIIFFLGLEVIWPIFFSVVSSLKLVRNDWQEAVKISNLKGINYLKKFLLPVSFPAFVIGSIIGLGDSWQALIATEIIVVAKTGLGSFFTKYAENPTITFWAILGFLIIIFSINKLLWLPLMEKSHKSMEE